MVRKFTRKSEPGLRTAAPYLLPNYAVGGVCFPCPNFVRSYYCRCPYAHLTIIVFGYCSIFIIGALGPESQEFIEARLKKENRRLRQAEGDTNQKGPVQRTGPSTICRYSLIRHIPMDVQIKYSIVFSAVSLVLSLNSRTASLVSAGPSA